MSNSDFKTIADILMYLHVPKKRKISDVSLDNLITQKTNWNNLPTKAIRVPEKFADQILEIAKFLDSNKPINPKIPTDRENVVQAISILEKSLKLPANKGGAIKSEIRKAINLLHGCKID